MAVGVIAVETQAVTRHLPADPGMPDSSEQNIPQARGMGGKHTARGMGPWGQEEGGV